MNETVLAISKTIKAFFIKFQHAMTNLAVLDFFKPFYLCLYQFILKMI